MKTLTIIAAAMLITGCATTPPKDKDLQAFSSGRIGCDPDAIHVSNWVAGSGYSNWDAECKGKKFKCTGSIGGSSCTPVLE